MQQTEINDIPRNMNEGFDHFLGDGLTLKVVIKKLQEDDSQIDSAHLYIAANTAFLLEEWEATFELFYKAQIRTSLEFFIFGLGEANGNNIETYLGYLQECASNIINPLSAEHPEKFKNAINKIETWNPVANPKAYNLEIYGEVLTATPAQKSEGEKIKLEFLSTFGHPQAELLDDPNNIEEVKFLQAFHLGEVEETEENVQRAEKAERLIAKFFGHFLS